MKKWALFLTLYVWMCLLAGCAPDGTPVAPSPDAPQSSTKEVPTEASDCFATLRIITGAESGELLLSESGEAGTAVYLLLLTDVEGWHQKQPFQNGQLINVYFETTLETYPAQFSGVSAIKPVDGGFDNRATLYLQVLEDLWKRITA